MYAPLANRLGIWQLKWELEDLSFRFMEPDTYKRIAKLLDEKRIERESYRRQSSIERLQKELAAAGIKAEVRAGRSTSTASGRRCAARSSTSRELYDMRAFRVIVADVKDCYTVLGLRAQLCGSRSRRNSTTTSRGPSRTATSRCTRWCTADDGRPLEVQIRTQEMHDFAEYGVAAHWRYKEAGAAPTFKQPAKYDEKIAWLRQLLAWKSEVADAVTGAGDEEKQREWVEKLNRPRSTTASSC